jgi:hypothetical protein
MVQERINTELSEEVIRASKQIPVFKYDEMEQQLRSG